MLLEVVAKSDIAQHEYYPRGHCEYIGTIFVVGTLLWCGPMTLQEKAGN